MYAGLSVLVMFNTHPPDWPHTFAESEQGVLDEVKAVCDALQLLGIPHRQAAVRNLREVSGVLATSAETVIFNLVEGFAVHPQDACVVPSLCRAWGRGWTGNDTPGLVLTLDKWQTKAALRLNGLPCPQAIIVEPGTSISTDLFPGPWIVKPLKADASEGIDNASVIHSDSAALSLAVHRIHEQFRDTAIVEKYIEGRELNVSVLSQHGRSTVLPLAEIDFSAFDSNQVRIVGYDAKWKSDSFEFRNTPRIIPAPLPHETAEQVRHLAAAACRAVGCDDYCRVDFRLDSKLQPYIIEINANPDISPDAGFAAALDAATIPFVNFVADCVRLARSRSKPLAESIAVMHSSTDPGPQIRFTGPGDLEPVMKVIEATHFFYPAEVEVAREVLADAINHGPTGHYQSYLIEEAGTALGWICFGPTPCTLGTFDIYWMAVAPDTQGRGLGTHLLKYALEKMSEREGRLAVAETSGRDRYLPTRKFYEKRGFTLSACSKDFYAPGDDKIIYTRFL